MPTAAAGGRPAAREQYCEPEDYFRGPHAACLGAVSQQYHRDVAVLQFEPRPAISAGTAAAAGGAGGSGGSAAGDEEAGDGSLELSEAGDDSVAAQARRLRRRLLN